MSIATMLEAITLAMREALPTSVRQVLTYDGQFSERDLDRFVTMAPAVFVSCEGFREAEDEADDIVVPGQWCATVVTKRTSGKPDEATRISAALAIVEAITPVIRDSNSASGAWADESSSAPTKIQARNIHSVGLDEKGLTMWLVTWEQSVSVAPFDSDALDAFLRADTTFSFVGTDDVDPRTSTITTTLEGPE